MTELCEACELQPRTVVESCDDASEPYLVCTGCHQRLLARSLRPLEWFNLAKRHSWSRFLLHDDFYDEDGTAAQPEDDVESPEQFPAPSLEQCSSDPAPLFDYTMTRWNLTPELAEKWRSLPSLDVLSEISFRFLRSKNPDVRASSLEIAAAALGESACGFVRSAWNSKEMQVCFFPLVKATAACVPLEEGYELATAALAAMSPKERRDSMSALAYFRSSRTLDWIEANICEPSTESWGHLAASSQFSWPRCMAWLTAGRPLSLVAIDALRAIAYPTSIILKTWKPELLEPPSRQILMATLNSYASRDPVPRVTQRVENLLKVQDKLVSNLKA